MKFDERVAQTTEKYMADKIADFWLKETPLSRMISKTKPLTRWQSIILEIKYQIRGIRERLGEIIAGREFNDGGWDD